LICDVTYVSQLPASTFAVIKEFLFSDYPEDGSSTLLWNNSNKLPANKGSYQKRLQSSSTTLWKLRITHFNSEIFSDTT